MSGNAGKPGDCEPPRSRLGLGQELGASSMKLRRPLIDAPSLAHEHRITQNPGIASRPSASLSVLQRIFVAAILFSTISSLFAQTASRDDPEWHYRQAQEAMQRQDYEAAANAWEAICGLMPDYPEAHSNLGLVYHLQRKYSLSIPKFQEALRQNPRLLSARVFLGIGYYLTSRPGLAVAELTKAASDAPENFEARKWLALSHFQAGDFGSAIKELQACQRLEGNDAELLFHLGRAYRKVATKAFFTMRQSRFDSAWFFLSRGDQFERLEDRAAALEEFRHAARVDPALPGVHFRIGQLLETRGESVESALAYSREAANSPAHARATAALTRILERLGMTSEALQVRQLAEAIHARNPTALRMLSAVSPGSEGGASASAQDRIRITGALPELLESAGGTWTDRTHAALLAGEPQRALECARRAIAEEDGDDADYWLGRAHLALGEFDKAFSSFLSAQEDRRANPEVAFFLHRCADQLSARSLESYSVLEPDSYRTHQLRAEYFEASGDHERAVEQYRKALSIEPGAAQLHLEIGKIYLSERKYDKAIAAFLTELGVDAYSVEALTRLGEAYYLTLKPDEALGALERALSINPKAAAAHKVIGQVHFKQREFARSVEHLRFALDLGMHDDGTVHYQLGRALSILGNREEASKHLSIVKRLREARSKIVRDRFKDLED